MYLLWETTGEETSDRIGGKGQKRKQTGKHDKIPKQRKNKEKNIKKKELNTFNPYPYNSKTKYRYHFFLIKTSHIDYL